MLGGLATSYEVVTIENRTVTRDADGDSTSPTPTPRVVDGALVADESSVESTSSGAPAVFTARFVYLPSGEAVGPDDRLRIRDDWYVVDGKPADWGDAGVVVAVKRAS